MGEGRYKNQPAVLRRYQGKGVLQPLPVPEPCPQPNTACRDGYRARKDNAVSAAIF